jgi:hypothetical protein
VTANQPPTESHAGAQPEFVRLPGGFLAKELGPALMAGSGMRVEVVGQTPEGAPLFSLLVRTIALDRPPAPAAPAEQRGRSVGQYGGATTRLSPAGQPSRRGEPPRGERKARHLEEHLCLKCTHHTVCRMAGSLDASLLVTITSCLAFEPADPDEPVLCELVSIPPVSAL